MRRRASWGGAGLFALLVFPWLNARASGPSASVEPWLISALCCALAYGAMRPAAPSRVIGIALACVAGWTLSRSGFALETLAAAGSCLVIFMASALAASCTDNERLLRAIAFAWLAAALLSTLIALFQYFGVADAFNPWISTTTEGEAFANLRQRNQFASLTVIGMATLFWLAPQRLGMPLAMSAMAWLAIGNAATTSRTGLAEMMLMGMLALLWRGRSRERTALWVGGLAVYALAALVLPWLLDAATGTSGHHLWERVASVDSCSSRSVLWANVLHLVAQRPWIGWGWGELDYAHYYNLYGGARFCDILDNAHNLPLHIAVELGVPAALAACIAVAWVVVRAKPWLETDPRRQMAWGVVIVIALHSMLEYPLWYGPFQISIGLAIGLLCRPRAADGGVLPHSSVLAPVLASLTLVALVWASWDYSRVSQIYLPAEARAQAYRDDPLAKVRHSWLFRGQAAFAEVTLTPLTLDNKEWMFAQSQSLLHYSPEPRIIEKVIESATLTNQLDVATGHLARFRAAFPESYAEWSKAKR
ncbi:polymerase [Caenimonas koreensis DSM 17982]|uniref:Polymerase n=1 Tax=Caenimonas koreensis DSM 17982 TaxID=1121255 RepID=A0A844B5X5_9BURK|nr:polymerase [Caenimonas koreensis DSM 17982]